MQDSIRLRSGQRLTTTLTSPHRRREIAGALVAAVGILFSGMGPGAPVVMAATTVNLDQWASLALAWQNGNLNASNSRYPEGGVVPFRLAIEGLSPGSHEIHINYDFTAGGNKAYDFLATWNDTNGAGAICSPSGGAISSMCPSLPTRTTYAFPPDPFRTDGLSVAGAELASGMSRQLTLWGGTITSVSSPVHSGPPTGNSSADIVVRFRSSGSAALLAWGGHLGQSSYWNVAGGGDADGASLVSGSPWHMRTLQLDGTGNKNQDRSISPSAIVGAIPPVGAPPPGGATPPPGVTRQRVPPPDTSATPLDESMPPSPGNGALIALFVCLAVAMARFLLLRRSARLH